MDNQDEEKKSMAFTTYAEASKLDPSELKELSVEIPLAKSHV